MTSIKSLLSMLIKSFEFSFKLTDLINLALSNERKFTLSGKYPRDINSSFNPSLSSSNVAFFDKFTPAP